jgi:hypothetical protein
LGARGSRVIDPDSWFAIGTSKSNDPCDPTKSKMVLFS